jgi:hypothetical protein
MDYNNIEHKDLPPVGGVLSGTVSEGDLGIETALANRVNDLTRELEASVSNAKLWEENYYRECKKASTLEQALPKMVSNELITNTGAKEIADIFGLEITKTVSVSGNISFAGQIEISIFEDTDELDRYELEAELSVSYGYNDLSRFDYDLDSVEFEDE